MRLGRIILAGLLSYQIMWADVQERNSSIEQAIEVNERVQHIWSGWAGECEYGTFTDFSFLQDPMFWASVMMSLYGGAMQGELGDAAKGAAASATESVGQSMAEAGASMGSDSLIQGGASIWQNGAMAEQDMYGGVSTLQVVGAAASVLAPLLAPASQQEQSTAFNYQQAWMGGDTEDPAAINYSSCMASIGLSATNLISYQGAADSNITADILYHPWDNPLRISNQDYLGLQAILGGASGDSSYFVSNYRLVTQDAIGVTLIAKNMASYEQLGQVMCAGYRVSSTINQTSSSAVSQATSDSGGNKGAAMAANAAIAAIGIACPICGLAAMVAYKFISSFSSGDACNDEKFALGRGKIQWKTNKFQKFGQCHFVNEECSKKTFWSGCITHKKHYCCYDQITTRVFVEGAKEELGRGWDNCNDIYIADLKNIGFRQCGPNETPANDKCLSASKYAELRQVIMRQVSKGVTADSIEQQVKNSMALPK